MRKQEALAAIVRDFLRYMQRSKEPAYSRATRRRNERKAWEAFSVMTAKTQRQALKLVTLL